MNIWNGEKNMKRWLRSLSCILLAITMIVGSSVTAFAAVRLQDDAPHDFVLLLDCSGSLRANDPDDLCLEACKSFVDLLPSQNTRVAVLGFGYTNGPEYSYSPGFAPELTGDADWVHEIVPMGELSNEAAREEYKQKVETVYFQKKEGKKTPIGQAVSAGIDMLKKNGSADGKACIILITDGVDIPSRRLFSPAQAAPDAAAHQWPIYCVGLNYNGGDPAEISRAQALLEKYCAISGNANLPPLDCATPEDVYSSLIQIFGDFYGLDGVTRWLTLPADTSFEIPAMTSEAAITVFGKGVESLELTHPQTEETYKITESFTSKNLIAVVEKDAYLSIRMIVPTEGTWNVHLEGKGGVEVQFSETDIREMDINMVTNPIQAGKELTRNDRIRVDACFAYCEFEVHNNGFYNANPATLVVSSINGTTREFTMDATKDGYSYDLALSEIPSGSFELQVAVKHGMFRDGVKLSNIDRYQTENKVLENLYPDLEPMKANVNHSFEMLDMTKLFRNPDQDPIEYQVKCTSDSTHHFDYTVNSDNILFEAGMKPGTYEVEIQARDPEMAAPISDTVTLIVEDRTPTVKKIADDELWVNCYGFQSDDKKSKTLDLAEYIIDPDGVKMTFTTEADANVLEVAQNGSKLVLKPVAEGVVTVKITGNDGVSDAHAEFEMKVIDGKAAFWRDNWIYFAIALAIIVLIVLTIIILVKNKRVKGTWEIIVDDNGTNACISSMNIADYTSVGRRGRFLLKDLVGELLPYLDYPLDSTTVISYFNGNGSEKIEFVGVFRRKGCKITRIPAEGSGTAVLVNGVAAKGKANVYGGTVTFVMDSTDGLGRRLIVTMRLV